MYQCSKIWLNDPELVVEHLRLHTSTQLFVFAAACSMKCNLMMKKYEYHGNMSVNPDQVSDLLMVTRRLWPQQLAQRKQSWHLDYQFLRTRMLQCFEVCTLHGIRINMCIYMYKYIWHMNTGVMQMCPCDEWEILEAEAIRLSMEAAPEVLWQGWWEDGNGWLSSSKFNGFYCFACLRGVFDDVRICCGFAIIWYLSLCGSLFLSPLAAHKSLQWISDAFWGVENCPVEVGVWLDLKVLVIVLVPNNMCMQFTFL